MLELSFLLLLQSNRKLAGKHESFYLPFVMQADNGDAIATAAVQGFGIMILPDFILANRIEAGELQTILDPYEASPLGIYAVLPSNQNIPQRVWVLSEFLKTGREA